MTSHTLALILLVFLSATFALALADTGNQPKANKTPAYIMRLSLAIPNLVLYVWLLLRLVL
jgi:hypothetical protein